MTCLDPCPLGTWALKVCFPLSCTLLIVAKETIHKKYSHFFFQSLLLPGKRSLFVKPTTQMRPYEYSLNKNERTGATEIFTNFFDNRINETLPTTKKENKNGPSAEFKTPATIFCHTLSSFINNQHFSVATCFRGVLLCTVLERMSLFYTRYLENNRTFCIHVTFFWRYLIDKLRKNLLNCLPPFFQIFAALL